jgi:hypothetical protein
LPFCLKTRRLEVPSEAPFADDFTTDNRAETTEAELSSGGTALSKTEIHRRPTLGTRYNQDDSGSQ